MPTLLNQGSGILGLPFALKSSGVVGFTFLILFLYFLAMTRCVVAVVLPVRKSTSHILNVHAHMAIVRSIKYLLDASGETGIKTLEGLAEHIFGRKGRHITSGM